ncbi:MAG: NDP-sugar synthase [Syntrophomonadaceae bacterium]
MIMAAGVGSRLMPLTSEIPKPLMPVANRPLLENTVKLLEKHGFDQLICNLHHHAGLIREHLQSERYRAISMNYSPEEELLGTAGGVKNCEGFLDETFVVISGDALTDIDLSHLLAQHKAKGALATIALRAEEQVEQFGVVQIDEKGKILRFQEKPQAHEAISNLANTGIYVFETEIFKYIPAHQFYDFGKQLFPFLVKSEAPFYGVPIADYWCDVGNLATYRQANEDILEKKVRAEMRGTLSNSEDGGLVLLDDGVLLGPNVRFYGNVVIGRGCRLEANTSINNSVIWDGTVVDKGAVLEQAIVGSDCHIGALSFIRPGAVIASGCDLEPGSDIAPGAKTFKQPVGP